LNANTSSNVSGPALVPPTEPLTMEDIQNVKKLTAHVDVVCNQSLLKSKQNDEETTNETQQTIEVTS
jgi:hypothetical protein